MTHNGMIYDHYEAVTCWLERAINDVTYPSRDMAVAMGAEALAEYIKERADGRKTPPA